MDKVTVARSEIVRENAHLELIRRFSDRQLLTELIKTAAREAVLDHKRTGHTISAWQDGRVVIIQPEDIVIPED